MNKTTYALPKDSKAWQFALNKVAHLLPSNIKPQNAQALQDLPIFAVVVVVDKMAMDTLENTTVDEVMQDWVSTQLKWQIQKVSDDRLAKTQAHQITVDDELASVSVFRYLLLPTDNASMTPEKRDAAAHIIDDQLTVYLKKSLKPKPNYNFQLDGNGQVADFEFGKIGKTHHVDVHILSATQMLRRHKVACFDMDSTLIHQEVIVELAKLHGVEKQVAQITESAMRGEIDFSQSFAQRVALLKDAPESIVQEIIDKHITIQAGAHAVIRALKAEGYFTVLVSGGFMPFAKHVAQTLGIDEYYANHLSIADGKLTGEVDAYILDGKQKACIASRIADRLAINLNEVVCVGDGANDLPMMHSCDIGIAYKAKPIVQAKADAAVNITGLEGVLYALGHRFDKI